MRTLHLHLISDSTGETVNTIARACSVQFEGVDIRDHLWPMVRTMRQLESVIEGVKIEPGLVLYTLIDQGLKDRLVTFCQDLQVPCLGALDPFMDVFARFLGAAKQDRVGRQHLLDAEYFNRIEAMNFVMQHDDGQSPSELSKADVVLVGVSRTSKTPTCIYLANRGIKAANVPIVPNAPLPPALEDDDELFVVGLTEDPNRLVQIRRNRMRMLNDKSESNYTDLDAVKSEVAAARRLYSERGWPVIDVTRRSIEETAAAVMQLYLSRQRQSADQPKQ